MTDDQNLDVDETTEDDNRGPEGHASTEDDNHGDNDSGSAEDTFPRKYVEELRNENAKYRQRAQQADDLAHRVHRLMVERTGRLADPDDLPFNDEHLEDEEALTAAIDSLIESKPHLASRKPTGDIGQGATEAAGATDLAALMRRAAG